MNYQQLESSRLTYTPFQESDFDDLVDILTDPVVCEYLPGDTPYSVEMVKRWLSFFINSFSVEKKNLIYAIRIKGKEKLIGYCGCNYVTEFETNEIKYILNKDYFGFGYATEAASTMKVLAQNVGLTFLVGLADIHNIPSQRVLEKIGYEYQKTVELWGATLRYYELHL